MTPEELKEIENLAVIEDRLFDPCVVIALLAEVRRLQEKLQYEETCHAEAQEEVKRLNMMVDKACQIIAENPDCAIDKTGVRKYLESEVADK